MSDAPVDYDEALAAMTERAAAIARGDAPELVWLLEHPALYTAGTSARPQELIDARFPVHTAGRGGQFTYHGPGQRVGYVMLDLRRRAPDVRRFVATIEEWLIQTLAAFNVRGERREDRIGVWVRRPDKGDGFEDKIAAIGIRVRQWVTLHGFALNIEPDLTHFAGIVPCGVSEPRYGVTSLADLGLDRDDARGRHGAAGGVRTAVRRERRFSDTSQHREEFAAPPQRQIFGTGLALIDCDHARARRPFTAKLDHGENDLFRSREQRLDRAVAAVAHPALDAAFLRRRFGPGAITDALHVAADDHLEDHVHPNSFRLRPPAPSGCAGSQRRNEAM